MNSGNTRQPDWSFQIAYFVAKGDPDPDVPWPEDWEVCSVPDYDPFSLRPEERRKGEKWLAWPMYSVPDPKTELNRVCAFLEGMTPLSMEVWLAMKDRHLSMSCGDLEMDLAQLDTRGFFIPGELMQHLRRLRVRLRVSFHPDPGIRWDITY